MRIFASVLGAFLAFAPFHHAWSQNYPSKPIRFIVPFVAGGPTDVQARWIAQKLNQAWGQPVIVENRPGAGGTIGTEMVARAAADGYTLLAGNPGPLTIGPGIYEKLGYDTLRDLAPVVLFATTASVIVVHPSLPVKNIRELIALAKARPQQLTWGSPGVGTIGHLAFELFNHLAGTRIVHVPYKGAAQSNTDLIAGHIQILGIQLPAARQFAKDGKVRALAIGTLRRSPLWPDLPTVDESGLKGFEYYNWNGVLAPAGTPRAVIDRINTEILRSLQVPENRQYLENQGYEIAASTPEDYGVFLKNEIEKWSRVIRLAKIKAN